MKRSAYSYPKSKPRSSVPTSVPQETTSRGGKRVKFRDIEVNNPSGFGSDSSSMKSSRRSDEAKTSEFAFFKKLKQDSAQKIAARFTRGNVNVVDDNPCGDVGSLLRVEDSMPVRFASFNSSSVGFATPKNSDANSKKARAALDGDIDIQMKAKYLEEYGRHHALRPEGTQQGIADIFESKRQKLRRWVTDTTFPEINGHGVKGCEIVSKLLGRLIPESKDNYISNDQKFGAAENDANSLLTVYPDPNIHLSELEFGCHFGDGIPYCQSNSSRERIRHLDVFHDHGDINKNHRYLKWDPDFKPHGVAKALYAESDSHFAVPIRRFRSTESHEEIDEFLRPSRFLVTGHSNTPMLGWDFDTKTSQGNLSLSLQEIEPNTRSTSLAPRSSDDKFYEQESFSMPLVCISSSYHNREFGLPMLLEDEEDMNSNSNHNALALSYQKSYFTPVREYSYDTSFHNQDHSFMSNLFGPENQSHALTESLASNRVILGLDWRCFPLDRYLSPYQALEHPRYQTLSHHSGEHNEYENFTDDLCPKGTLAHLSAESKDDVDTYDWSSSCFHVSI